MNLTLGVAAHVDAGKTTLCEQLLRRAGVIRACGRVDHGDAFMDDDPMERARGITIFTEQATLSWPVSGGEPLFVTLMDTPGHVDFSGEMERALSVLDAALLVVSCAEGVQSHTATLFKLLQKRKIPTIIFLNKTDRE
ncbi:MAG: GTP-binding protein, partial [Christensenellales bacterium]|nr:GTP-binding protein [Christensenellales bacterium]